MTKTRSETAALEPCDTAASRIQRAQEAIAALKSHFVAWVRADLDRASDLFAAALNAKSAHECATQLEDLRRIAHNIKGQGGTFGCDGVSAAAEEIDHYLKRRRGPEALDVVGGLLAKLKSEFDRETA
jgi:chemotaxis protein histidine kinase CheA